MHSRSTLLIREPPFRRRLLFQHPLRSLKSPRRRRRNRSSSRSLVCSANASSQKSPSSSAATARSRIMLVSELVARSIRLGSQLIPSLCTAACFGIDLDWDWPHEEWLCHMCERDQERKPLCLHPFCVLCPTPKNIDLTQPMTALDCMKETELSKYVCSREHLGGRHSVLTTQSFTQLRALALRRLAPRTSARRARHRLACRSIHQPPSVSTDNDLRPLQAEERRDDDQVRRLLQASPRCLRLERRLQVCLRGSAGPKQEATSEGRSHRQVQRGRG